MAAKPLTSEAIAMTEKKMDMALDDIIKMSKTGTGAPKAKNQRVPKSNQKFSNNAIHDKSMKLRRFMDSRSSLRQGVLAQRRSSFKGNQFPFAAGAARKAAVAPIHKKDFSQSRVITMYKPRFAAPSVRKRADHGGFAVKQVKKRARTLDSLFANMKEERMKVLSQQNSGGRRNRAGYQRPRPPWGRYNN